MHVVNTPFRQSSKLCHVASRIDYFACAGFCRRRKPFLRVPDTRMYSEGPVSTDMNARAQKERRWGKWQCADLPELRWWFAWAKFTPDHVVLSSLLSPLPRQRKHCYTLELFTCVCLLPLTTMAIWRSIRRSARSISTPRTRLLTAGSTFDLFQTCVYTRERYLTDFSRHCSSPFFIFKRRFWLHSSSLLRFHVSVIIIIN